MPYGSGPYGGSPYAGVSFSSTGPSLTLANPTPDSSGLAVSVPITFQLQSTPGLDLFSLAVHFNGTPVILGGGFLPGFNGTAIPSADLLDVVINVHPDFMDGVGVAIEVYVADLAMNAGTFNYTVYVGNAFVAASETVSVSEGLGTTFQMGVQALETVAIVENGEEVDADFVGLLETITVQEHVSGPTAYNITGTSVFVPMPQEVRYDNITDVSHFRLTPLDGGVSVTVERVEPQTDLLDGGVGALIIAEGPGNAVSHHLSMPTHVPFDAGSVGDYIELTGPATSWNAGSYCCILEVLSPTDVRVDVPLIVNDPANGSLAWTHTSAVRRIVLTTQKTTNGKRYAIDLIDLTSKVSGSLVSRSLTLSAASARPSLTQVESLGDGSLLVTFGEPMRMDAGLFDTAVYAVMGPTAVSITDISPVSDRQVKLETFGMGAGAYTLTIDPNGTPHDLAGNPIDGSFNVALFSGSIPLNERSIFTDKGPIAKPPLTLQSGSGGTITSPIDVTLPGGTFGPAHVGKRLVLSGTTTNGGSFLVVSVPASNKLRVVANLHLPDASNGSITWALVDPRDGVVADSPLDVTVRVNGSPVVPSAVIGLRGQIVLPTVPAPTDDVKVTYSWIDNPTVEARGLNNPSAVLNGTSRSNHRSQHTYQYRSVLVRPSDYIPPSIVQSGSNTTYASSTSVTLPGANLTGANVGMTLTLTGGPNAGDYEIGSIASGDIVTVVNATFVLPDLSLPSWTVTNPQDDIQARLVQPLLRDMKYRAYERAYTAVLNDPNLLVLNTPTQRIAYPPLSRQVEQTFISYDATTLPEIDPVNPWQRIGDGAAAIDGIELVVNDNASTPAPAGSEIFWTRPIDLTFDHAFAAAWRFQLTADPVLDGIFTGVAVGFSDDKRVCVVGYLDDGGIKKFGILRKGSGDDPSTLSAWTGGIDGSNNPTSAPTVFDWPTLHSYRIFQDTSGVVRVYVNGEVVESLRVLESELPYLEELAGPFSSLEGLFFGSISRTAQSTSRWDFLRYEIIPTNPVQTAPSSFVSYEATDTPENSVPPWTPVGYHGTERIAASSSLVLESTSATDQATETSVGLVGGDFRGYVRIEPLLSASSDIVVDAAVQVRTQTHGIAPNAIMFAIDDGDRLMQVSFISDRSWPKYSYGGRVLPDSWTPTPWVPLGTASVAMHGRTLRISDATTLDGRVYSIDDASGVTEVVVSGGYAVEIRTHVLSYTPDLAGFCGVTADSYNGARVIGLMLREVAGVRYVTLHSDGIPVVGADFAFEWFDGAPHTYKFVVSYDGSLVSVFVDGDYVGSAAYTLFTSVPPVAALSGISWGSGTTSSIGAVSVVDWYYANAWKMPGPALTPTPKPYVGVWKGSDPNSLVGYHLPVLADGRGATVLANALGDSTTNFILAGVTADDYVVIDYGPNKGTYQILSVAATSLTIGSPFPYPSTNVDYRIPKSVDWTANHNYRFVRAPNGDLALFMDSDPIPLLRLGYDNVTLPPSSAGILRTLSGGLPCVAFGAFDPTNLSETSWDYVRYGIVRPPSERAIVPPHQVLNQRNVIASPEHLRTTTPHAHTDYWSSSTGIPPQMDPDFLRSVSPAAYTRLNEGTPLVPSTQTSEVRHPVPVIETVAALNSPDDVLNNHGGFTLNDPTRRIRLLVPNDVLYNSLRVIETSTGDTDVIAPFDDRFNDMGTLYFQKEHCLVYDGSVLPENDTAAQTPWTIQSVNPAQVSATVFTGILTYSTLSTGTTTIYKNPTPLPDSSSFATEFTFRLRLANDASLGMGDSQVRFGFSAPGVTFGIGLVTTPAGDRYVYLFDMNSGAVVGGVPFDFLDGAFHDYRVVYNPGGSTVNLFIDA